MKWPGLDLDAKAREELQITNHKLQIPRAEAMSPMELRGCLNVAESHPVLRGVLEVIGRAEDMTIMDYCGENKTRDERADGGVAVRAIRNLRADLLAAVEEARKPRPAAGVKR